MTWTGFVVAAGLAFMAPQARAQDPVDHAPWDALLRQRVQNGLVDYAGLKSDPQPLDRYLAMLRYVEPGQLSAQEQMAFWINAYNACVFKGVLDHYPIRSVKDVQGFFDKLTYPIGGETLTLNQIESKGRALGDWRVHFAVVCASTSCPTLRAETYLPERLDAQLSEQAQQFLRNPEHGMRVDETKRVLWVSKIFKWYAKDFVRKGPLTSESLLLVLRRHADPALLRQAEQRPLALNFLEYDWTLNDQGGAR